MTTLGIRNNNPFNIRFYRRNKWKGCVGENRHFCVFESLDYGLRAGVITLRTYIKKHRLESVESIISRFAPSNENDTHSYISYCRTALLSLGYSTDIIKYKSHAFVRLCCAICMYESGLAVSMPQIEEVINKFNL